MVPLSVKLWGIRILIIASILLLGVWTRSSAPALGLMVAWCPNLLFLAACTQGALRLPRFLEPVKRVEVVLYSALGVGLVKRVVATRMWPLLFGAEPPAKPTNRQELLDRAEQTAKRDEICHFATLIVAFAAALYYLAVGRFAEAAWISAFNLVLNGYPVMLQRVHRWRVQQVRAKRRQGNPNGDRASVH